MTHLQPLGIWVSSAPIWMACVVTIDSNALPASLCLQMRELHRPIRDFSNSNESHIRERLESLWSFGSALESGFHLSVVFWRDGDVATAFFKAYGLWLVSSFRVYARARERFFNDATDFVMGRSRNRSAANQRSPNNATKSGPEFLRLNLNRLRIWMASSTLARGLRDFLCVIRLIAEWSAS